MPSAFTLRMDDQDRLEFIFFDPTDPAVVPLKGVMDRPDAEVFFNEGVRLLQESAEIQT
jgi:hypothetical protein